MFALAQTSTASAVPTASTDVIALISQITAFIGTLLAIWQWIKAQKATGKALDFQTMFHAAANGLEAAFDSLPKTKTDAIKSGIQTTIIDKGGAILNEAMKAEVDIATTPDSYTVKVDNRPDGLPKLILIPFFLVLTMNSGCVNAGIREAAIAVEQSSVNAQDSADVLYRSSVPNPAYNDEEKKSWEVLWARHIEDLKSITKAAKAVEDAAK